METIVWNNPLEILVLRLILDSMGIFFYFGGEGDSFTSIPRQWVFIKNQTIKTSNGEIPTKQNQNMVLGEFALVLALFACKLSPRFSIIVF